MQKGERAELVKWYDAMDALLGSWAPQDIGKGMRLARECKHEDATWFMGLFPNDSPATREEMKEVLAKHADEARGMFFAACICGHWTEDKVLLRRAAEMGYAPAQAWLAGWSFRGGGFEWAQRAAAQKDRNGLFGLSECLREGDGCDKDEFMSLEVLREAAELGHAHAQFCYGERAFKGSDWQRYYWWGRAAVQHNNEASHGLIEAVVELLTLLDDGGSGRSVFEIGAACRGHVDLINSTVFLMQSHPSGCRAVEQAIALYDEWCANSRRAIYFWIWAAKEEMGLSKDIRVMIAKHVWNERAIWSEKQMKCQ